MQCLDADQVKKERTAKAAIFTLVKEVREKKRKTLEIFITVFSDGGAEIHLSSPGM